MEKLFNGHTNSNLFYKKSRNNIDKLFLVKENGGIVFSILLNYIGLGRKTHRCMNLPATIDPDIDGGSIRSWYRYDRLHNINGPADISYGSLRYYIKGYFLHKEQWEIERIRYL